MQKPKFPWLVVPLAIIFTSIILPGATEANLVELTPAVTAGGIYDDNLDYNNDEEDELEDYAYNIRPELSLKYLTNVLELEGYAIVDFLRYIEETVFDRTNQEYGGKIDYNSTPRLNIFGDYRYLKDESINSRFRATGRISRREPITSHLANGGFQFDLTELTFIRPQLRFYKVIYEEEADNVDFETYSVQLPFNLRLKNQRDTLFLNPGYERFENEDDDTADSFSLTAGWSQTTSEKINFNIELGGRYTIQENAAGDQEDKWNGVLRFNLDRIGETSLLRLDLSNRLGVSTFGILLTG